jgi:MoaA/NifB/PqqE/SkfB family radical SAM enzyme
MKILTKEKINFLINTILRDLSLKHDKVLCKPTFVSLAMSEQCCLRCRQCDIWKNKPTKNQLSFEQRKNAVKNLKNWLGNFKLNITGGEPFLNKQTIPLISYAQKLGVSTFINSNGYLIDNQLAKEIVKSRLSHLSISLDSTKEQTHDYIRGVKGSFQKALGAIRKVKKYGQNKLQLSITSIILENNLADLKDLVYLTKKLNLSGINFQPLMSKHSFGLEQYNPLWFKKEPLWPKNKKLVIKVISRLIKLKKQGFPIYNPVWELEDFIKYFKNPNSFQQRPCLVGISNFSIDVKGDVRLCFSMNPIANIKKQKPKFIWKSKIAEKQRKLIKNCQKNCRILLCNRKYSLAQVIKEAIIRRVR